MKLNENYNILSSSKSLNSNAKKTRQPKFEMKEVMVKNKSKNNVEKTKKISVKYILEGGVIKVYLFKDGVKGECIKTIPLSQATPEILAKVENITFLDIVNINDIQKKEEQKNSGKSSDSASVNKEIEEYMKHLGMRKK